MRVLIVIASLTALAAIYLFVLVLGGLRTVSDLQGAASNDHADLLAVKTAQQEAAAKSQALFDQVKALGQTPVVTPAVPGAGPAGTPGRGIAGTTIRDGRLVLFFSDGTTSDVGQVAGAVGAAGVSISATLLVNDHLMITYSDGRTVDVGQVVGQAGPAGVNGKDGADGVAGRSVSSVANVGDHLVITYSDSTTQDVGALPVAEAGRPPSSFSYTDPLGTAHECTPDTPPDPGTSPHYSCN